MLLFVSPKHCSLNNTILAANLSNFKNVFAVKNIHTVYRVMFVLRKSWNQPCTNLIPQVLALANFLLTKSTLILSGWIQLCVSAPRNSINYSISNQKLVVCGKTVLNGDRS